MLVLRLLNGVALGGLMPLAWALNIEFVPSRYRASVVTIIPCATSRTSPAHAVPVNPRSAAAQAITLDVTATNFGSSTSLVSPFSATVLGAIA